MGMFSPYLSWKRVAKRCLSRHIPRQESLAATILTVFLWTSWIRPRHPQIISLTLCAMLVHSKEKGKILVTTVCNLRSIGLPYGGTVIASNSCEWHRVWLQGPQLGIASCVTPPTRVPLFHGSWLAPWPGLWNLNAGEAFHFSSLWTWSRNFPESGTGVEWNLWQAGRVGTWSACD